MPLDHTPVPDELHGLRLALLVSGGIAAYKVVDLASALAQAGCQVRVAMTPSAMRFVGPPSFQGVTGNPVLTGLWSADGSPEPHVALGDWAQLILLAPATANVIGRVAGGRSDDIVTATLLAARCPVVMAPAMNDAMWSKQVVRENVATLRHRGITVVEPETGHLASGHVGTGRLADASKLLEGHGRRGAVALRPGGAASHRHGGRDPRADRRRPLHQQLLDGQDGIRHRGRGRRPRRAGDAGVDSQPPGPPRSGGEGRRHGGRDAGGAPLGDQGRRPLDDGRGGRRLSTRQGPGRQDPPGGHAHFDPRARVDTGPGRELGQGEGRGRRLSRWASRRRIQTSPARASRR